MNDRDYRNAQEHPLYKPLMAAIHQAMFGKGERHGGATVPFLEQPIFHYAKMHGRGFLTGQAAKKAEEAASTRHGEAFVNEILGAIVYLGAAVIREQQLAHQRGDDRIVLKGFTYQWGHDGPGGTIEANVPWPYPVRPLQPATSEPRNCEHCLHKPREHTEWPCNECTKQPEVLPHFEPAG